MFPKEPDPKGEPENWSEDEMRRWLNAVSMLSEATTLVRGLVADDPAACADFSIERPDGRKHGDESRVVGEG
jgi:hypothetical protein